MKMSELLLKQKVIMQFLWGEQKIEYTTEVVATGADGVYVDAINHNDIPLEFDIEPGGKVLCHLFADNMSNGQRVSWKNLEVKTQTREGKTVYFLKTYSFNRVANVDDRRKEERIKVRKRGRLYDEKTDSYADILVHDVSDVGISFYAPVGFEPASNRFVVLFTDTVGAQSFSMRIPCTVARSKKEVGTVFYGCRIDSGNKEYLLYGCMLRLEKKKHERGVPEVEQTENEPEKKE